MNIVVLAVVVLVCTGILGMIIHSGVNYALPNRNKLHYITMFLLYILLLGITVYSVLSYLGKVGTPIKQGVFRENVSAVELIISDTDAPALFVRYPSDKERYDAEAAQYD